MTYKKCINWASLSYPGADPEFVEGGFKSFKGGLFTTFYIIFRKFPHIIEIIWSKRGV